MLRYLFVLVLLSSCATTKFAAPDLEVIESQNGKVVGGTVVYNALGLEQIVDQRRNQAFKRMRDVCKPQGYKITKEETNTAASRNPKYGENNSKLVTGTKIRFVDFKCAPL